MKTDAAAVDEIGDKASDSSLTQELREIEDMASLAGDGSEFYALAGGLSGAYAASKFAPCKTAMGTGGGSGATANADMNPGTPGGSPDAVGSGGGGSLPSPSTIMGHPCTEMLGGLATAAASFLRATAEDERSRYFDRGGAGQDPCAKSRFGYQACKCMSGMNSASCKGKALLPPFKPGDKLPNGKKPPTLDSLGSFLKAAKKEGYSVDMSQGLLLGPGGKSMSLAKAQEKLSKRAQEGLAKMIEEMGSRGTTRSVTNPVFATKKKRRAYAYNRMELPKVDEEKKPEEAGNLEDNKAMMGILAVDGRLGKTKDNIFNLVRFQYKSRLSDLYQ